MNKTNQSPRKGATHNSAGIHPRASYLQTPAGQKLLTGYLAKIKTDGTRKVYHCEIRRFFDWHRGELHQVTPGTLKDYGKHLAETVRAATIKRKFSIINQFLNHAAKKVKGFKSPVGQVRGDVIALQSAGYHDSETFRRNLDGWLAKYRRPGTRETYAANVRQFFAWAKKAPGDLTESDFTGYRDHLADQGRAPSTVWLRFVALKGFLTYAAGRSRNLKNPLDIRRLHLPETRRDAGYQNVLTPKEAAALKRAPDRRTLIGVRDYAILLLMLVYGPRAGEVCKLTWADVDPERVNGQQKIWIRNRKGKGVDTAFILNGELLKAWDAWIAKSGLTFEATSPVFAGFRWDRRARGLEIDRRRWRAGKRLTVSTIENIVGKHIDAAGIQAGRRVLSPHALRHTAFTELAAAGTPLPTIKYIAGHQSVETTAIYTHHRQSFDDNVAMHSRFNR